MPEYPIEDDDPDPDLMIRLQEIPPAHLVPQRARTVATLFVAKGANCDRCDQLVPTLRIEPIPDIDFDEVDAADLDVTMHFCATCLDQLAREVREKTPAIAHAGWTPPPDEPLKGIKR